MSLLARWSASLALASVAACGGGEPSSRPPHVLVVTIDTLRADHLGCYGYFRDTSPSLDRLAAQSLLFERCLAPVAQTLPSHTSLFTGLAPLEHGVLANLMGPFQFDRAPGAVTLAQALSEVGYRTAAFVASEPLKRGTGIETGFASWWEPGPSEVRASAVIDEALAHLGTIDDRPTFTWVHLFDPHRDYDPPREYRDRFRGVAAEEHALHLERIGIQPRNDGAPEGEGVPPVTSPDHDRYDAEIRYADDQLARLLARIEELALAGDLLLVVTSDHGEGLWQHGRMQHGGIWLEQLHVPLLVRAPGVAPGRVATPLEMRDVLPTAIARAPALAALLGDWLASRTGRDALAPENTARPFVALLPASRRQELRALLDGRWRFVEREGLFDLEADPFELSSVLEREPERAASMRQTLEALLAEQHQLGRSLGVGEPRPVPPARRRALRELGYGGDDEDDR